MSELKIIGTIKQIGELQTFDSGFTKVEFVLTTEDQYPQEVKFEMVKEKADKFLKFNKVGDRISVKFNIRGNEYNGKHFVNLQGWYTENMESNESEGTNPANEHPTTAGQLVEEGEDDLPF